MEKEMLVYYNGGDTLECHRTTETKATIIKKAKEHGQVGFLSGFHYYANESQTVMVFFKEKPSAFEIERRRKNGLKRANFFFI